MPRVARFHGITVSMYYDDYPPSHIPAAYGGLEAKDPMSLQAMMSEGRELRRPQAAE